MDLLNKFKEAADINETYKKYGFYSKDYKSFKNAEECFSLLQLSIFYLIAAFLIILIFFSIPSIPTALYLMGFTFGFLIMFAGFVGLSMFFNTSNKYKCRDLTFDLFIKKKDKNKIQKILDNEEKRKKMKIEYENFFKIESNLKKIYEKKELLDKFEFEYLKNCFKLLPNDSIEDAMEKRFNQKNIKNL